MDEAAAFPDKEGRYEGLAKAERLLLDDYIFAPMSVEPNRHLVKPTVKGFGPSAAGYHNSQWMTLE